VNLGTITMQAQKTHYDVIGVNKDASQEEIKQRCKDLLYEEHPDRKKDSVRGYYTERFKEIEYANSILSDPVKRAEYDQTLNDNSSESANSETYTQSYSAQAQAQNQGINWFSILLKIMGFGVLLVVCGYVLVFAVQLLVYLAPLLIVIAIIWGIWLAFFQNKK
jgi:curved DNA-binding protein CbpA